MIGTRRFALGSSKPEPVTSILDVEQARERAWRILDSQADIDHVEIVRRWRNGAGPHTIDVIETVYRPY